jgi:hypothetical protein
MSRYAWSRNSSMPESAVLVRGAARLAVFERAARG